ncbi:MULTISPECIES: TetR/AcrR family transcriptional regulator [unclassified Arcicella]|uniref:TetR/AcrR family transcriptional regulator n=1 Tax=unclassified Arcicella TaxID=2644986 RepID=UPI0028631E19|nr:MULTISPECIES: TetR/AcrR family transcriptional regulator [unclassified Arcicella]MDR6561949.1 AcrR family transcriptional regulator [Arcicella sp. BE51]MDR6811820.1 AcrR family transcriptional regulator [Arcicella sp. BE140]MDR6822850.1 AcrR family transcriptional regulator [Arcicella sp. BE139]
MASKDRILRLKEETRNNILDAACKIVKEEGWQGLSLRKIADAIEYTAPIIYEYFANKEAILQELTKKGYLVLNKDLIQAKKSKGNPAEQLEAMWLAYWKFAFENKEMYQLMFGVEMTTCHMVAFPEVQTPYDLFTETIIEVMGDKNPSEDIICQKYYTYYSVVHGLISINLVGNGLPNDINLQILKDAITGITRSLN